MGWDMMSVCLLRGVIMAAQALATAFAALSADVNGLDHQHCSLV
jgi:hypothetical protein